MNMCTCTHIGHASFCCSGPGKYVNTCAEMDGRVVAVCGGLATAGIAGVGGLLVWRLWQRRGGEKRIENPYETQLMVDQYLAFHYAPPSQYMAYSFAPKNSLEFPSRCAALCKRHKVQLDMY